MDLVQILILLLVGLAGGVLSGIVGVGGGIIFVPGLVYATGWSIQEAVAASLVIIVFSSLSGTIRNARSQDPVRWPVAGLLSLTVAPASLIGVFISRISPERVVEVAFALLLLALAYPTARGRREGALDAAGKRISTPLALTAGVGIGAISGLVGVGGGVMLVPLMVLGFGVRTKTAVSTSLAVVLFTALVGATGYILTGFGELLSLPPLIVGAIAGAWLGVRLRDLTPDKLLRRAFGVFMVIVALQFLGKAAGIL